MTSAPVNVCSSNPFTAKERFIADKKYVPAQCAIRFKVTHLLHQVLVQSTEGIRSSLDFDHPRSANTRGPSSDSAATFPRHWWLIRVAAASAATNRRWVRRVFVWLFINRGHWSWQGPRSLSVSPRTSTHNCNFGECAKLKLEWKKKSVYSPQKGLLPRQKLKRVCAAMDTGACDVARDDTQLSHQLSGTCDSVF